MKIIIVDDEMQSHKVLSSLITSHHPDLHIMASGYNVQEGLELVEKYKPDLVFLDIEMPDGLGFDLLKKIGKPNFKVIFITAHEHYALSAIKFGALDYILKPVSPEELKQAITKAREKVHENISQQQLQVLFDTIHNFQERKLPTRICISTSEGIFYKLVKNIIRLEAQQNYTAFSIADATRKILASINIGEYVEQFDPYVQFMKVHRSHLVNLEYVDKYVKADGGYLVMKDGSSVSVSRPFREELLERLTQI
jgi:two-component system LytT family response regulator